jgi:hypothetical protein
VRGVDDHRQVAGDARQRAQVEVVEGLEVPDQADDRAGHPGRDEGLAADGLDALHHAGDVLGAGVG